MDNTSLLAPDTLKIAVVGEPGCGKTTFIQEFYSQNLIDASFYHGSAIVYPCQFCLGNEMIRVAIFEYPGGLDTPDLVAAFKNCLPNAFVLMYAIDDLSSFQMVTEKYIPSISLWKFDDFSDLTIVLMGSKADLRDDKQVIERLAQKNRAPVTPAQGKNLFESLEIGEFFECSSNNLFEMYNQLDAILHIALAHRR